MDDSKLMKVPFNGKRENYLMWAEKFKSWCVIKGVSEVILQDVPIARDDEFPDDVVDPNATDPDGDAKKISRRKKNRLAYSMLAMSISDPVTFSVLSNSKPVGYVEGHARTAWLSIQTLYKPTSNANKFELENKFNHCVLSTDNKDPDEWFAELESMRMQLRIDFAIVISNEKMVSHIVYNTRPRMYQTTLAIIKRELNNSMVVKLENLKKDLRQVYLQNHGNESHRERKETVLIAAQGNKKFPKRFKGDCRICGRKGHKAGECWENDKNKDKRPSVFKPKFNQNSSSTPGERPKLHCTHCGKDNHTIDRCFKKQKEDKGRSNEMSDVMMISIDDLGLTATEINEDYCQDIINGYSEKVLKVMNTEHGPKWNRSYARHTWILDSGSTSHMRFTKDGMSNLVSFRSPITCGNKEIIYSEMKGTFRGQVVSENGTEFYVTLEDVLYVPGLFMNLFSLTKALENPKVKIERIDKYIALVVNKNRPLVFNKVIPGGNGHLLATELFPATADVNVIPELQYAQLTHEILHNRLGHPNDLVVQETAKKLGFEIHNKEAICADCALAKIKRKKISKKNLSHLATRKGERLWFDISSVNTHSQGGNKFWLLIIDEFTKMKWSFFMPKKSMLHQNMFDFLKKLSLDGIKVSYLRCDNSGENNAFEKALHLSEFRIQFEYTAPYTPEQNGITERSFQTLFNKTRATLNKAFLPKWMRDRLWAQCARLTTMLDTIVVNKADADSPYEKWNGKSPAWLPFMRMFGEVGVVQDGKNSKIKSKLANRGYLAMFVGYPDNHSPDVYQMYNWIKKSMILSRNVVWLDKTYADVKHIPKSETWQVAADPYCWSDSEEELIPRYHAAAAESLPPLAPIADPITIDVDAELFITASKRKVSGFNREVYNLTTSYNPDPASLLPSDSDSDVEGVDTESDETEAGDIININYIEVESTHVPSTFYEFAFQAQQGPPGYDPFPKNYRETLSRKDKAQWQKAMWTEFDNIESKRVWQFMRKRDLPFGRKTIGNRWVYIIKDDGRYRARTVAKGYSQIPGKDFHENHAPVVHDTSFHLTLVQKMMYKLNSRQFDIETAFLYGDLEEEIYMEFPDGYEEYLANEKGCNFTSSEYCVILKKALYGLVQAARQWWKKITETLQGLDFHPSPADPCLFVRKQVGKEPPAFVILYVDDGGIIGTQEVIVKVLKSLSKVFTVKDLGVMEHFVGCHLIENKSRDTMWIHQPKLIKHLEESFKSLITSDRVFKTPAAPKTVIMRPQEGDTKISAADQSLYRSGVGMLLYLIKHSRPDLSNSIRELTKVLDGATPAHWKAMLRVIKYVFDTKMYALKLKPNTNDKIILKGISDSEYAGDRETRISVYGYVIYYCGAPISWKSKSGRSVTLSSTEAEYYACSEAAKELVFVQNLIKSMGIELTLPIQLHVDNTGAIYLANNYSTGQRTKHIDIRAHFVRELIVDGVLKIIFVKTEDNDADIFTKNTSEEIHLKHSAKMIEIK